MFSEINLDNEKYRFDSEFFQKKYLEVYSMIKNRPHTTIGKEYSCLTDFHSNGSYESIAEIFELLDHEDYAYMVRTTDLEKKDFKENIKYISRKAYEFLSKSKVYGGELLINKIGSPGRSFLMPKLEVPTSLGMNLFLIKIKEKSEINEKIIWIFLNTKYGKDVIQRKINGTVPLTIDKEAIKSLYIPIFSKEIVLILSNIVEKILNYEKKADLLYEKAKEKLLQELNLEKFNPSSENVAIKSLKESFLTTSRLDSEYYQKNMMNFF